MEKSNGVLFVVGVVAGVFCEIATSSSWYISCSMSGGFVFETTDSFSFVFSGCKWPGGSSSDSSSLNVMAV